MYDQGQLCRVGPMSALGRALKVDLRRAVLSRAFVLTVALLLVWLFLNCLVYLPTGIFKPGNDIVHTLEYATDGAAGPAELLLAIATVPYAWSYIQDRNSGFEGEAIQRVGFRAYGVSKIIAVAVSTALAAAAAIALFLGMLYASGLRELPVHPLSDNAYFSFASGGHVFRFYLVRMTITALGAATAATAALAVSVLVPNIYVALMSSMIIYYLLSVIVSSTFLGRAFYPTAILFEQTFADACLSFLWVIVLNLTCTALCGRFFLWRLRKEQGL